MIDPLLASVIAGISAACVISYLFGRLHGAAAALRFYEPPRDWPSSPQGDLPNIRFHPSSVAGERQRNHV